MNVLKSVPIALGRSVCESTKQKICGLTFFSRSQSQTSISPILSRERFSITVSASFFSRSSMSTSVEPNSLKHLKGLLHNCVEDIMKDHNIHLSFLVSNLTIKEFCSCYESLIPDERQKFLLYLCDFYAVHHDKVLEACNSFTENKLSERTGVTLLQSENRLRTHLQPKYNHLFKLIGRLESGVKFLSDMRYDALMFALGTTGVDGYKLRDLSDQLKSLLGVWFSVGLLQLRRITWETPADILEKIAKYEAVHSVRSWVDLKHRLGDDRRCYAFFHSSMPREPLLLLHIALTDGISNNITDIVNYSSQKHLSHEDISKKNTAIFYSITNTQKGLQGIEFGVHMVRAVVQELCEGFPNLNQFSSLSPLPRFANWLINHLSQAIKNQSSVFKENELTNLKQYFNIFDEELLLQRLHYLLTKKTLTKDELNNEAFKAPLVRLCAEYLFDVKSRGYAFDPVANFHLRNGATLWRVNWMADPSPNGIKQSFGIMVNYRYYLNEMEENSRRYMLNQNIAVSPRVLRLKSDSGHSANL